MGVLAALVLTAGCGSQQERLEVRQLGAGESGVAVRGACVPVSFTLAHPLAAGVDVALHYTVGADAPRALTPAAGATALLQLASSEAGTRHTFLWSSVVDLPQQRTPLTLRLTATGPDSHSVEARAQVQLENTPRFFGPTSPGVRSGAAYGAAAGDFDGDGRAEVVTAVFQQEANIVFHRLEGAAGLVQAGTLTAPGSPVRLVTGHFNADQRLDLAVALQTDGVVVFLNQGEGRFGAQHLPGFVPGDLEARDVTGDGVVDLLSNDDITPAFVLMRGSTHGAFSAPAFMRVPMRAGLMAVGDVTGDARPDVVLASHLQEQAQLMLLVNTGGGAFTLRPEPIPLAATPDGLEAVDVDADGHLDLVAFPRMTRALHLLRGDGAGSFVAAPPRDVGEQAREASVADLDADGRPDLLVAFPTKGVQFLLANGPATFSGPYPVGPGSLVTQVATGDVDGDGTLDVVFPDLTGGGANPSHAPVVVVQQPPPAGC